MHTFFKQATGNNATFLRHLIQLSLGLYCCLLYVNDPNTLQNGFTARNVMKITKENFITDQDVNRVYISSLLDKESSGFDQSVRERLVQQIRLFDNHVQQLVNTKDVWVRDYMPIQLTDQVYLDYIYRPDYLHDIPQYATDWQTHQVHASNRRGWSFQAVHLPLLLDGGNVVKAITKAGQPCLILCDKILKENKMKQIEFDDWWQKWWKDHFEETSIEYVLLPWEGSLLNPIGHADGIVRYVAPGRVLLTNYTDFDPEHAGLCRERLQAKGFEVEELSYLPCFDPQQDDTFRSLFDHTWCYINFLQVGTHLLIPQLGYSELDQEAVRQIKSVYNRAGIHCQVNPIDLDMSSIIIVDSLGKKNNGGGALNCLTWTTKE